MLAVLRVMEVEYFSSLYIYLFSLYIFAFFLCYFKYDSEQISSPLGIPSQLSRAGLCPFSACYSYWAHISIFSSTMQLLISWWENLWMFIVIFLVSSCVLNMADDWCLLAKEI